MFADLGHAESNSGIGRLTVCPRCALVASLALVQGDIVGSEPREPASFEHLAAHLGSIAKEDGPKQESYELEIDEILDDGTAVFQCAGISGKAPGIPDQSDKIRLCSWLEGLAKRVANKIGATVFVEFGPIRIETNGKNMNLEMK